MYTLILSDRATEDIAKLKRNEPNSFKKISKLLHELILPYIHEKVQDK